MMPFVMLPDDVRRAVARRELRRRGIAAAEGPLEQWGAAYASLLAALRVALPDEAPVFVEGTRRWARQQPTEATHRDKCDALALRIEAGALTGADLAVLGSLPPDQLAAVDMDAAGFVRSIAAAWASC